MAGVVVLCVACPSCRLLLVGYWFVVAGRSAAQPGTAAESMLGGRAVTARLLLLLLFVTSCRGISQCRVVTAMLCFTTGPFISLSSHRYSYVSCCSDVRWWSFILLYSHFTCATAVNGDELVTCSCSSMLRYGWLKVAANQGARSLTTDS